METNDVLTRDHSVSFTTGCSINLLKDFLRVKKKFEMRRRKLTGTQLLDPFDRFILYDYLPSLQAVSLVLDTSFLVAQLVLAQTAFKQKQGRRHEEEDTLR